MSQSERTASSVAIRDWQLFLGRCLLAMYFMHAAAGKAMHMSVIQAQLHQRGMPFLLPLIVFAALVEAVGAVSLVLGYYHAFTARVLLIYTLLAVLLVHFVPGEPVQMMLVMRDLSLMGGLLLVAAGDTGALALKRSPLV